MTKQLIYVDDAGSGVVDNAGITLDTDGLQVEHAIGFGAGDFPPLSGTVEVPLDTIFTGYITSPSGVLNATLLDGLPGQLKFIKLNTHATYNLHVNPTHFIDGTRLNFTVTGQYALLIYATGGWAFISGTAIVE